MNIPSSRAASSIKYTIKQAFNKHNLQWVDDFQHSNCKEDRKASNQTDLKTTELSV